MNEIRNIIIGFQLGRKTSQICYYDRKLQEAVSLSVKAGSAVFEFPTALCKTENSDIWYSGFQAENFGQQPGGIYVDSLYHLNEGQESITIDHEVYEPWQLLGIFFRESLKMLGIQDFGKSISCLMVTAEILTTELVTNLKKALDSLGLKKGCGRIQNYGESFYYYTMYQKPELRVKKVALLEFGNGRVAFRELQIQSNKKPMLVTLSKKQEFKLADTSEQWDADLFNVLNLTMETDGYSSAYLVGDGFDKAWALRSLPRMAKAVRRIFSGNNLFVKGACYGAKESVEEKRLKEYLYVGEDLVRTNVGMEMMVQGMNVYYPLIVAGVNWYDTGHGCDLILDNKDSLNFISRSMENGEQKVYAMELPDLPKRPNRTTRLHLEVTAVSANECRVEVTDMGFGEMFPATGKCWIDSMEL